MKRQNSQALGEVLKDFFQENEQLYEGILEKRAEKAWGELFGPYIMQYTSSLYIKNHVLYVSLSSAVLRNELSLSREKLIKSINDHVKADIVHSIVFR